MVSKAGNRPKHGGQIVAEVLCKHGVEHLFTLCGGHISPILVSAKALGIRVVDVRHEVSAVFAADASARMRGGVGVAAVTAGPGVTNTVTAVKNAQMAQIPLLVLGGATATILKGRGSLQDIDQLSLMRSVTKWAVSLKSIKNLRATIERALELAQAGTPGPVFVEIPVDLLYPEAIVREWYMDSPELKGAGGQSSASGSTTTRTAKALKRKAINLYVRGHLYRQFHLPALTPAPRQVPSPSLVHNMAQRLTNATSSVVRAAKALRQAERPVLIVGSQALVNSKTPEPLAAAVRALGIPTFLAGSARGLLGRKSSIQLRHKRSAALRKADLVIVAGFPFDFRLNYGHSIGSRATVIAANLNPEELRRNRRPEIAADMHPGQFVELLANEVSSGEVDSQGSHQAWFETLQQAENAREDEIRGQATTSAEYIDPIHFFIKLEELMAEDAVLVVDGGDFVATASYILRPRSPLSWLDPGVFGTLGVGGGFAVGAALCRPDSEVWLIYGDGSSAYSLAEFDTCKRHGLSPIAVIGNDGCWSQIAREQIEMLGDPVGTELNRSDYHIVAQGYGAHGLLLDDVTKIQETIEEAQAIAKSGTPVVINLLISASDFRRGSISM